MLEHITTEQLDVLRANAIETLQAVNKDNPSKEMFILIGSCLAVLDYGKEAVWASMDEIYSNSSLISLIKEELMGSEKYLQWFRLTQDHDWVQSSYDNFTHAKKLIGIAQEHGYDVTNYEAWSMDLGERISRL